MLLFHVSVGLGDALFQAGDCVPLRQILKPSLLVGSSCALRLQLGLLRLGADKCLLVAGLLTEQQLALRGLVDLLMDVDVVVDANLLVAVFEVAGRCVLGVLEVDGRGLAPWVGGPHLGGLVVDQVLVVVCEVRVPQVDLEDERQVLVPVPCEFRGDLFDGAGAGVEQPGLGALVDGPGSTRRPPCNASRRP